MPATTFTARTIPSAITKACRAQGLGTTAEWTTRGNVTRVRVLDRRTLKVVARFALRSTATNTWTLINK